MNKSNKKSLILYHDLSQSTFSELSDAEAGKLIKHIVNYSVNLSNTENLNKPKEPTRLNGLLKTVAIAFEIHIERDFKAWSVKAKSSAKNGKKGGRPKKINNLNKPKKGVKVKVKVKVKERLLKSKPKKTLEYKKINISKFNEVQQDICKQIIDYRLSIKKPLKTEQGLSGVIKSIKVVSEELNFTFKKTFQIMQANEWQTVKLSYMGEYENTSKGSIDKMTETDVRVLKIKMEAENAKE